MKILQLCVVAAISIFLFLGSGAALADSKLSKRDQECLALAMYWEARGEGYKGMLAVGSVILNRVASPEFPQTVCGVIYEGGEKPPCQFSWWCDGKSDRPVHFEQWQAARKVAADLAQRRLRDPTRGALFFHSAGIKSAWHQTRKRTGRVGNHIFYR